LPAINFLHEGIASGSTFCNPASGRGGSFCPSSESHFSSNALFHIYFGQGLSPLIFFHDYLVRGQGNMRKEIKSCNRITERTSVKFPSEYLRELKGDEKMRNMTLLIGVALAVLVLGLSMAHAAGAEQFTAEPDALSSDISKTIPSSFSLDPEDQERDADLKRGRVGGGRPAMRPAARPAARPVVRPAGRIARPAGHVARPIAHHGPRPAHPGPRIAHHPGHHGHHPGHHIHHPGQHHHPGRHHPGRHHHPGHHRPVGLVGWVEPGEIGGVTVVETGYIEPTVEVIEPEVTEIEPEETEVETEEVEEETEDVEQEIEK
jgi:hypothetical protein